MKREDNYKNLLKEVTEDVKNYVFKNITHDEKKSSKVSLKKIQDFISELVLEYPLFEERLNIETYVFVLKYVMVRTINDSSEITIQETFKSTQISDELKLKTLIKHRMPSNIRRFLLDIIDEQIYNFNFLNNIDTLYKSFDDIKDIWLKSLNVMLY